TRRCLEVEATSFRMRAEQFSRAHGSPGDNAMKTRTPTTLALCIAISVAAAAAVASSAHFVRGPFASIDTSNAHVTVTWKEAGLGDTATVEYEASADGTARYQCVNRGGNCPAAANKQDVNGPVTASGAFASGKNGTITASLTF